MEFLSVGDGLEVVVAGNQHPTGEPNGLAEHIDALTRDCRGVEPQVSSAQRLCVAKLQLTHSEVALAGSQRLARQHPALACPLEGTPEHRARLGRSGIPASDVLGDDTHERTLGYSPHGGQQV